jgi:hypothetical protein
MKNSGPAITFLTCSLSSLLNLLDPNLHLGILIFPIQGLLFGLAFTYSNPRIFEEGNLQKWFYSTVMAISCFVSLSVMAFLYLIYFIAFKTRSEFVSMFFPGLCFSLALTLTFSLKMRSVLKMNMVVYGTLLGSMLYYLPDFLGKYFSTEDSESSFLTILILLLKLIWLGSLGAFMSYYGEKELLKN